MNTKIDWCDEVWNPTTGCTKECSYCYAKAFAERMKSNPNAKIAHKYRNGFTPTIHPECLTIPQKWKKPRRVFVDSMGDLFDPEIPTKFISEVIATLSLLEQHTFMILTKQPGRMYEYLNTLYSAWQPLGAAEYISNLWLGVTVTKQNEADAYIPYLSNTPAAKRFVSVEPMRGPISIAGYPLDWVICGGMTGPKAVKPSGLWVAQLRDQCKATGVPFYFKGWGGKQIALLDGKAYREFPA